MKFKIYALSAMLVAAFAFLELGPIGGVMKVDAQNRSRNVEQVSAKGAIGSIKSVALKSIGN